MVRLIFALIFGVTFLSLSHAQNAVSNKLKEVKVGEPMPEIMLGEVMNNTTGKTRFSDFKGKLIILDFWNVKCVACIKAFPKMATLQEQFKDQIQIFFVNPSDKKESMIQYLTKGGKKKLDEIIPPSVPSIINAKHIENLFPPNGETGYHVWIDGNGIVRLKGPGALNTYEEKIRDLLAGKEIDYITDDGLKVLDKVYRNEQPFFTSVGSKNILQFSSAFSGFDDKSAPYFGRSITNQVDSATHTIRNSFLNTDILKLYQFAVKETLDDQRIMAGTRVIISVADTSMYTTDRKYFTRHLTDRDYRKCQFSYEQITPLGLSETLRKQYMLEDLNRYFNNLKGVKATVEEKKMHCYVLVRTSSVDKIKARGDFAAPERTVVNGKKRILYRGATLRNYFGLPGGDIGFINKKFFAPNYILLDETAYNDKIDIELPDPYDTNNNFEDLRKALQEYDLDIVKQERKVKMLVIQEKDLKN